jgi:hypothetical protein
MEPNPKDSIDMEQKYNYSNLPYAIGTIEVGLDQQERFEEFTERLATGEFHVHTNGTIPSHCIDGRHGGGLGPNGAGGTETLLVADDLTTKRFVGGGSLVNGFDALVTMLLDAGLEVGVHDDEKNIDDVNKTGCGANDRLAEAYTFLIDNPEKIRDLAIGLGVEIDNETYGLIVTNASARKDFPKGKDIYNVVKDKTEGKSVDHLTGSHREVVAVINTKAGTTLDRDLLKNEFGENYQAFNIDVWSFEEAARATSLTPEEVDQKVAAMVVYNLAIAHVLCGPNMRVIVL